MRIGQGEPSLFQDPALALERQALLQALLERFDVRKVQIVVHRYCDEMTQSEIADLLGISERAVRKALAVFLKRAGKELAALEAASGYDSRKEGRR